MFSSLRERFGTAGLIVAVIALIAAVAGTAIAAGGLTKSQEKQVKKIAKKYAGKQGPAGPAGPQGPAGAKGDNGAPGQNGAAGAPGKDGQSVTGTPIAAGGACGVGVTGFKYTLGTTSTNICNGKNGADGQTGFTETLPSGESEYGNWGVGNGEFLPNEAELTRVLAPIAFVIPYPGNAPPSFHYVESSEVGSIEDCPGDAEEPLAEPGTLCVYESEFSANVGTVNVSETTFTLSRYGVTLFFTPFFQPAVGEEPAYFKAGYRFGTWAVTAPEPTP